ncbi:MAG: glycosyltransferase [Candidatus Parabeggiatoa sp.]|nr:glycosyltransferase [Candidatus Parabeggiatoa sp.]
MLKRPYYQTFSIIIPTFERPQQLARCLEALAKQQYPRENYEVIVSNDGGQTSLQQVVEQFQDKMALKLIKQLNAGQAAARNGGAAVATGRFLAFIDDDCVAAPDWLSNLAKRFAVEPSYAIGGQTINALTDNLYATASQMLIAYLYSYYHLKQFQATQPPFFASNNLALPAEVFQEIDGFNETLRCAEDRDLCERWQYAGYRFRYAPEVLVSHFHDLTLRTFIRQHFNYGRGNFRFQQLRQKRRQSQNKIEASSFYLSMLHYPFSQQPRQKAFLLSILLVISQLGNIAGFAWERLSQKLKKNQNKV